jgi:hypothetical protein
MTKEELAATLNGRQYTREITSTEEVLARESGLLVLFGASDDLAELRGAIDEELGACDGVTILLGRNGELIHEIDDRNEEEVLEKYGLLEMARQREKEAHAIHVLWCATPDGPSWSFATDLPAATFKVMEDDEVYCQGLVIDMKDVRSPAALYLSPPLQDPLKAPEAGGFSFFLAADTVTPMLELKANGDIMVRGKLIENDKELVDGLREWFRLAKIASGR